MNLNDALDTLAHCIFLTYIAFLLIIGFIIIPGVIIYITFIYGGVISILISLPILIGLSVAWAHSRINRKK